MDTVSSSSGDKRKVENISSESKNSLQSNEEIFNLYGWNHIYNYNIFKNRDTYAIKA